jgi:hypothetical protein
VSVAKLVRDGALADAFPSFSLVAALRGSQLSRALSWGVALVSVALPPYVILSVSGGDAESSRFLLLGLAFLFASTLNLAKVARDSFEADLFSSAFGGAPTPALVRTLRSVSSGTAAFRLLNTLATVVAFATSFAGVWANAELARERKALFTVGLLFVAYGAFQVSKLVRDFSSAVAAARPKPAYATFTWGGFLVALVAHGAAVALMPVSDAQRRFFGLASVFVLSSVLALAKLLRDDQEREDSGDSAHAD